MSIVQTLFVLILALPGLSHAQGKVPVNIDHSGDDTVGIQFAYTMKERIRASRGMELTTDPARPQLKASIVTIDIGTSGLSTAISTTILYDSLDIPLNGAYLTSFIQTCGREKVQSCADSLIALIDKQAEFIRTKHVRYWNALMTGKWETISNSVNTTPTAPPTASPPPSIAPAQKQKPRVLENPF